MTPDESFADTSESSLQVMPGAAMVGEAASDEAGFSMCRHSATRATLLLCLIGTPLLALFRFGLSARQEQKQL